MGFRRFLFASIACLSLLSSLPAAHAASMPSLEKRVQLETAAMNARYATITRKYGMSSEVAMMLATQLGMSDWSKAAQRAGVRGDRLTALWRDLKALPHPNFEQLTPYNLLAPAHDRWGVSNQEALKGWAKYGSLIEEVAIANGLDPAILGAYVWTESNFDTHQLEAARGLCAVGLGSVQAQDYPSLGPSMSLRIHRLQDDPRLNLTLTAREFKSRWNPHDMFGTVMDVWYPSWRSGRRIPNMGNAFGYMQLFSNRYFALLGLFGSN